jgi:hypothetical protein
VQSTATHKAVIIFSGGSGATHPVHPDISSESNEKMVGIGEIRELSERAVLVEVVVNKGML